MSQYDQEKMWSDFRVGVVSFMALFLVVLGVTFAGGDKGLFFKKTSTVLARLPDIGGLKKGSTVTMGGMVIGKVTGITFVAQQNEVEVRMEIRSDLRPRIKKDSVPAIRTQGMLGDRYIDISMGDPQLEPLGEGKFLVGKSAADFDTALDQAGAVLEETQKVLNAVNERQGTVGQFFYDEKFYQSLTEITDELNELIKDFKKQPRKYIKFSLF